MSELKPIISRDAAQAIGDFLADRLPDGYKWVLCVTDNNAPLSRTTTFGSYGMNQRVIAAFIRDQADQMDRGEQPEFPF